MWESRFGTLLQTFKKHEHDVLALAVTADEGQLFSTGTDGKVVSLQLLGSGPDGMDGVGGGGGSKWVYSFTHRPHTHDVRALAVSSASRVRGAEADGGAGGVGGDSPLDELLVSGGDDSMLCSFSASTDYASHRPARHFPYPSGSSAAPCAVAR
jgi:U3 small nucleolar RNA-associated protein 4